MILSFSVNLLNNLYNIIIAKDGNNCGFYVRDI